jgi:hypothetical protein
MEESKKVASRAPDGPNNRTVKAMKRLDDLIKKYEAEGMSNEDATNRAREEMADNDRGDWRAG